MASIERIATRNLVWLNIEQPDESTIDYLNEHFKFHQLNLQDTVEVAEIPKVDIYRHYLFIVLHFPYYDDATGRIRIRELNVFVNNDHLITLPEKPIPSLRRFFNVYTRKTPKNKKAIYKNTTGYLLYKITNRLFREVEPIIDRISKDITKLENHIYEQESREGTLREIAVLRRNVLTLRRVLDPQRTVVRTIGLVRRPFLPQELEVYYDDVRDALERMWHLLGGFLEFLKGLEDTYESLISHRTNKIIHSLTIISVSLLPPTLLASMYGMNIALPFAQHPLAFWILAALMVLFEIVIFSFFKRQRWL